MRRLIAWTFLVTFVLVALVLGSLVMVIHGRAAQAVRDILGRGLAAQSGAAADAMQQALARGTEAPELGAILRRVRDAGRLDAVTAIDLHGCIAASADSETPLGTQAGLFAADPQRLMRVAANGAPEDETMSLLGESFHRTYLPITHAGTSWGVLVLEAHDPTAAGLTALHWPLWTGLAVAILGSMTLAGGLAYALHLSALAQVRALRHEQLASAGMLAAAVAHEVRNPLQLILAATQTMERNANASDRELLSTISDEVRRADDQLEAFLDVARDTPLRREAIDLRQVVQRTVTLLAGRARQADISVVIDLPDLPVPICADPRKLRQALVNLLLNAIQAIEQVRRPGTISLRLIANAHHADLTITDDGPGIPAALRATVFDPFVSTRPEGTGLGLPQAQRTAERHGGRLVIVSSTNAGSTLLLSLPTSDTPCAS